MPSFRKDRPERRGPPGRSHREEPEESEERSRPGPGPSSFLRRPEGMRPSYESAPRVPDRSRDWTDFIVPASEKADPNFKYSKVFDVFAPSNRGRGQSMPPPPPPPREGPREERRPGNAAPSVSPANWFDMNRVWAAVQTVKADQRFRPGSPVAVVQISNPSSDEERRARDLIRFFGIPPTDAHRFHGPELWTKLLSPFLDELAYAINYEKPREIPGKVKFQVGNDGSFWLAYTE
jgi:hypothetical protein